MINQLQKIAKNSFERSDDVPDCYNRVRYIPDSCKVLFDLWKIDKDFSTVRQTMTEVRNNYEKAQRKLETADANLKKFLFLLFKIKNVLIVLLTFQTRSDRLTLASFDERLRELEDIRCECEQFRTLSRDIYATETYKIASEEHSITIKLFLSIFIRRKSIL
ncbi:unnamed protein product [Rotaria sordida]|uniref:Uncharacterized protein n=1 Tax=Rotaria sordida TaxID=392033 RepID=A0A814JSK5_9BILA|nr:unnamed protein product [Rotaria sordida]CAF1501227.1 unnamed protein product [Rotaria sordida]